jgi:hypothetical protein
MFGFVFKLSKMVGEFGSDIVREVQPRAELQQLRTSFDDYFQLLFGLVKKLANERQLFKELYIRLDYNWH